MYTHSSGIPVQSARGLSSAVRGEFDLVEDGFDLAAPLASPAMTGTPTVPTAAPGTATTQAASTAFVSTAVSNTFGSSYTNSTGTSVTSLAIGTGSKVFETQTGKNWVTGMQLTAFYDATNYMICTVTSYSGTTLTLDCAGVVGSGTYAVWALFSTVWYREVPVNEQSAAYTTVLADSGKQILHPSADTTARVWTIDSNANVPYPVGTILTFNNQNGAGTLTIAITSDTMRLAGPGTTGSRTLTANGIATAVKETATVWKISGTNLA